MPLGHVNMAASIKLEMLRIATIVWLWARLETISGQDNGVTEEYCFGDKLEVRCGRGEVLLVTNATYGRMELGRCVEEELKLGCSADVSSILQSLCSGRRECVIHMAGSPFLQTRPCGEMLGYLQASYTCKPVIEAEVLECSPGSTTKVPLPSGTLANVVSGASGCGNREHPWVIEADTTQTIRLKMMDLTPSESSLGSSTECELYVTVKESSTGQQFEMCQGHANDYVSMGNKLEVTLRPPALTGDKYFLLHYEVVGCPEPNYPADMWIRRGSGHVTVGCYSSRLSWQLECNNNTWQGEVGNCTELSKTVGGRYIPEIATPVPATDQKEPSSGIAIDSEVGLLLAVAGGVFLSVLLLAVGLLFDKSREKPRLNAHNPSTTPMYGTNTSVRKPTYNTTTSNGTAISNGHNTVLRQVSTNVPNGNTANNHVRAPQVRDSIADRSSIATGYYDVPHYYELDPDYEDGQNAFVSNGEKNVLIDLQ